MQATQVEVGTVTRALVSLFPAPIRRLLAPGEHVNGPALPYQAFFRETEM